jgi:hypothetical protein
MALKMIVRAKSAEGPMLRPYLSWLRLFISSFWVSLDTPTDLEWLACAITWLDGDLVTVPEMLRPGRLKKRLVRCSGI